MKCCPGCKQTKPFAAFSKSKRRKDGYQVRCKECRAAYARDQYKANKKKYLKRAKASKAKLEEEVRQIKEKTPCADCGKFWPYYVMQFDHVDDNKVDDVSKILRHTGSRPKVMKEISKCEVVCANCHAERSHRRRSVV